MTAAFTEGRRHWEFAPKACFSIGDRVELHPAHDLWMRGARFGTVEKLGTKWVHVRLDMLPDRLRKIRSVDLNPRRAP